jgi:hypothetical protein
MAFYGAGVGSVTKANGLVRFLKFDLLWHGRFLLLFQLGILFIRQVDVIATPTPSANAAQTLACFQGCSAPRKTVGRPGWRSGGNGSFGQSTCDSQSHRWVHSVYRAVSYKGRFNLFPVLKTLSDRENINSINNKENIYY